MASTYDEKKKLQTTATSGYQGTSANTQQRLSTLQQGYAPSQNVQNAQQQLTQVQAQRPAAYTSPYTQQLEGIYQQIVNRQPFKYDMNGDMLYQNAKDQYVQGGRQAMMDTMGQAASLTGGYGNSYASTAGNQAYQQYLLQLNAMLPDFYDRAAARYDQQGADLYNQYGLMQDRENAEYGRYQDSLAQWNTDYANAQSAYYNAYNQDYGAYQDALGYWQQQAAAENADYWAVRDQAYQTAMQMLANGQMPSADLLAAAGISQVDAQSMMPVKKSSGGGGKSTSQDPPLTTSFYEQSLADFVKNGATTGTVTTASGKEVDLAATKAKVDTILANRTPPSYDDLLKKMLKGG